MNTMLAAMDAGIQDARFLALRDVSAVITSSADLTVTLPLVARSIVRHIAEGCVIGLVDDEGVCRIAAVVHQDAGTERELAARAQEMAGMAWFAELPGVVQLQLSMRGRPAGTILLLNPRSSSIADGFLADLSARVSLGMENADLHTRERRLAQILQTALLPSELPQSPGRRYHAAYVPASNEADIGGDWYDAFPLADGKIVLSIGDVAGHGLDAAVVMGEIRQTFRVAAMHLADPAAVLELADHLLLLRRDPVMVTAVFGIYDGSQFTYASAGHPPPLIRMQSADVYRLPANGLPLGVEPNMPRQSWTITLPSRSMLVLYTDGLIEHTRNVTQGEALLTAALRDEMCSDSANPARYIHTQVLEDRRSGDDVAVLTLSVDERLVKELDVTYTAVPVAAPLVRHAIAQLVEGLELTADQAFRLQVAVGEAVSNVIEHAYLRTTGTVRVQIRCEADELHARIEDDGTWRPARQDDRGYGLSIIRSLMSNVQVNLSNDGTTVTFTDDLHARSGKQGYAARR